MSIIKKKYPNDFRIIYEKSFSKLPLTTLYIFCDIGPVYEYDKIRGASHFIEHMCFRGTSNLPSSKDLLLEFSKIGALFNAYTNKRYTCYTIQCQDTHIEKCLNNLSDMLLNSIFNENVYLKEEKIVIEENNNNDNNPNYIMDDTMENMLYSGSSYEYPIDTLNYHISRSLNYKDVLEFYHTYYQPNNMLLSTVTNLPFKDIEEIAKKSFFLKNIGKGSEMRSIGAPTQYVIGDENRRHKTICGKSIVPDATGLHQSSHGKKGALNTSSKSYSVMSSFHNNSNIVPIKVINHNINKFSDVQIKLIKKKGINNVHINIGFRTCGRSSKDKYILDLLSVIISNGMTGRLMMILREDKGLIYHAYSRTNYNEHSGDITFITKTKKENLIKNGSGTLPLLIKIINNFIKKGVTKNEIKYAKEYLKGLFLNNLEKIDTQTIYNGEWMIYGNNERFVSYKNVYDQYISKISLEDINCIIKKYFIPQNMCVCILSEKLPSLEIISKIINIYR